MKNFKFSTKCSCIICNKETTTQSLNAHYNSHLKVKQEKEEKACPKCGALHTKDGTYCSRKCANSRIQSLQTNLKRSNTLKDHTRIIISQSNAKKPKPENIKPAFTLISFCKICSKPIKGKRVTCSNECLNLRYQQIGKHNAAKQIKCSKDEIALYELCLKHFNNVEHNQPMFEGWDADIIIHDTKTAILWNGRWHYEETGLKNHSLKQVQNRDRIKINIIKNMGWTPIIFEDRHYTPEAAFQALILLGLEASSANAALDIRLMRPARHFFSILAIIHHKNTIMFSYLKQNN